MAKKKNKKTKKINIQFQVVLYLKNSEFSEVFSIVLVVAPNRMKTII